MRFYIELPPPPLVKDVRSDKIKPIWNVEYLENFGTITIYTVKKKLLENYSTGIRSFYAWTVSENSNTFMLEI